MGGPRKRKEKAMSQGLNTIAERICHRLGELHMLPDQLADQISLSHELISRWAEGTTVPNPGRLSSLSRILGCSVNWVATGQD